jgi:hypothetical protein
VVRRKIQPMHRSGIFTIFLLLSLWSAALAQTVTSFEGIDALQLANAQLDIDPNGAVGTKQYMEWVNVYYQAYDKLTFAPVWSTPQAGMTPWKNANLSACSSVAGDGYIVFDRLASRWVIGAHTSTTNNYYYCIAISNTDDLKSPTLSWFAYAIPLNSILGTNASGNVYFPDWPKLGTWSDAYYLSLDLEDPNNAYREVGAVACALDRSNMILGLTPNAPQCFREPATLGGSVFLGHSLIPAEVDGTTAPPAGRDEYFVSIQNPVIDGVTTTTDTFNVWDFHLDWTNPVNSTFTQSTQPVSPYTPGCYTPSSPVLTLCVPEQSSSLSGIHLDSVGDRFMPRLSYRNFGSYESFLFSHTIQVGTGTSKQSGVRWYELRGAGTPLLYQNGTVNPDSSLFRFMPSIAQDNSGEAAVGYSVSSGTTHPGIRASWWNLKGGTAPTEISLFSGSGDEQNTGQWGDYTSMTVDPVDGCTFWYVNEYFAQNQTGKPYNWDTRISNFKLAGCGVAALSPASGLTFGSRVIGTTSSPQVATLTNGQSVTLNIDSIGFTGTNSGDFAQTNTCGGSLPAGGVCTISVTFTPTAAGSRSATLAVTDDAGNSPQTVSVTGTGVIAVTLSATNLNFGNVVIASSSTAPAVTLTNNQTVSLTGINIATVAPFSQINTCGTSIVAGAKCKITVTFSPTSTGMKTGAVTITDSANNSPQTITLKGTGILPVTFNPNMLSFGSVPIHSTSNPLTSTLTNHEKVVLNISAINIVGANSGDFAQSSNCLPSVAAGAACTITVTFTPSATGSRAGTLVVTDDASTSPQSVKLTGTGQ